MCVLSVILLTSQAQKDAKHDSIIANITFEQTKPPLTENKLPEWFIKNRLQEISKVVEERVQVACKEKHDAKGTEK